MTMESTVVFRTSAGQGIGFGHLRRCISLANALSRLGLRSQFLLEGDGTALQALAAAGYGGTLLCRPWDPDEIFKLAGATIEAVVVDSYTVSTDYFTGLARHGRRIIAIDDLADRCLPVDVILNSSLGAESLHHRTGPMTRRLLGPSYALLRPEFALEPARQVAPELTHVLVTLGGTDPFNLTPSLIFSICEVLAHPFLDVVVGPFFENQRSIEQAARETSGVVSIHHQPDNMSELMLKCDLALAAGGQTTYELAATATPSVCICMAANQKPSLMALHQAGAVVWSGDAQDPCLLSCIKADLAALKGDIARRAALARTARSLVDGRGAQRAATAIVEALGRDVS